MDGLEIFWTHTALRQRDLYLIIGTIEIRVIPILKNLTWQSEKESNYSNLNLTWG